MKKRLLLSIVGSLIVLLSSAQLFIKEKNGLYTNILNLPQKYIQLNIPTSTMKPSIHMNYKLVKLYDSTGTIYNEPITNILELLEEKWDLVYIKKDDVSLYTCILKKKILNQ